MATVVAVTVAVPYAALAGDSPQANVTYPVKHGVSQPLADLPTIDPNAPAPEQYTEVNERNTRLPDGIMNAEEPSGTTDMAVQNMHFENNMPTPSVNFEGLNNINGVYPPDTTGDVGPNHYVQWVNLSFAIFDKTGVLLGGPFNGNTLWTGFGGSCETTNAGDPIVLYDHLADRWFMSQFTFDNHQCIAVSQSGDPLGTWYLYDYLADADQNLFNDYPKFGVWPDGYYFSANMFGNGSAMAGVFERDAMLVGDPAQFIWIYTPDTAAQPSYSLLPADLDGLALPPDGDPNPFVQMVDDAWGYDPPFDTDAIIIQEFAVDWDTPGNSTFTVAQVIDLADIGLDFDSNMCGYGRSCIPQPDTSQGLDALSSRFMFKLQYRNFGEYETLVTSHTVDENGADHAGVRWYEVRKVEGTWDVEQGSTYAPDPENRWMGDLAMDASGNIAVGYSVASATTYAGIRFAGRLAGDPLGTLAQGEESIIEGSGSQLGTGARWGDYSTMSVDPVDDCTFWYTQEYLEVTGTAPWQTRVAAFKFEECVSGPAGDLSGTVANAITLDGIEGAKIQADGFSTLTDEFGAYSLVLPEGTYSVTASKFGFDPATVDDVEVLEDGSVVLDFELIPVGEAALDGYVTSQAFGWPLYAQIMVYNEGEMVASTFTNPMNGYYDFPALPQGLEYELMVTSQVGGFAPAAREILLAPIGQTESFQLLDDGTGQWIGECDAIYDFDEDFDNGFPPDGWEVINFGGTCVWDSTEFVRGVNFTPGSGFAAVADSDWCGFGTTMATGLESPEFDFTEENLVILEFKYDYNPLGGSFGLVEVSGNGGDDWTEVAFFNTLVNGTYTVNVSDVLAGSEAALVRFVYVAPGWDWWFQVDDVRVITEYDCPPGSLATGFVTDDNTGEGLIGAAVMHDLGGMTETVGTPDDPALPDGYYHLYTPVPSGEGPATRTFTASSPGYAESEETLAPPPNAVFALDFALETGWLELVPDFLVERLNAGATSNHGMEVINYGGLDADVALRTTLIPTTWDYAAPQFDFGNLPGNTEPTSMGRAPAATNSRITGTNPDLILADAEAFGFDIFPGATSVYWPDLTAPDTWNVVGPMTEVSFWAGGDFIFGDFSTLYVIGFDSFNFGMVDTATGVETVIATSPPAGGENWSDMTAAVDGTLYAVGSTCASSTLYEIDPASGAVTPIGPITDGPCIVTLAINAEGEMYGVDIIGDNLVQIDPATGAGTIVGSLGVGANFAQGMDFDEVTGTLYWAAYTTQGELRVIDTNTGASSLVGAFPGGAEVDAFAVMTSAGGGGLPWLVLTPEEGTSPAGSSLLIDAEFIADEAPHYGLHQAEISVMHETPYDVNDAGVCFTKAFNDVGDGDWFDETVHATAGARITGGCGLGEFCPTDTMLRHVMARWLLKLMYGPDYSPPPCQGIFGDVVCESTPNADWIEQLYAEGVTGGCSADPLLYCPFDSVTRAQMAVFIIRALDGPDYEPAACTGVFGDVGCPAYWAVDWIEDLYARGITAGCSADPLLYCPEGVTSRAEMATFVQRAWELPMCEYEE
jgi:hypothetical protein